MLQRIQPPKPLCNQSPKSFRERFELIIEGSNEEINEKNEKDENLWKEYEFYGKPGRIDKQPIQIAPYHLRLDWLMWFAAMNNEKKPQWIVNLIVQILMNNKEVLNLLEYNPFPDSPPKYIRILKYKYNFVSKDKIGKENNNIYYRKLDSIYIDKCYIKKNE